MLKLSALLYCLLLNSACASNVDTIKAEEPSQNQGHIESYSDDDPFSEDDAYDYLTAEDLTGEHIVSDDYFDDDDYLDDYSALVIIRDPLSGWNRFWFGFNDVLIDYGARPVSKAYNFVTPAVARKGLKNFFYNLRAPVRIINCLLQGKGQEAGVEFSSFFLNTLAGFGGFVDIASQYDPVVPATNEDFGQTLGAWGVGEGIYLVWPVLGPSNVRDTFGTVGNYFMGYYTNPIAMYGDFHWTAELGIIALDTVNGLSDTLKAYDTFKDISIDPYTAMRDGYTQLRRSAIAK